MLGPTVAGRIGGAARRLGTVAGVPVSGLLSARGVAAEGPPRVRPVVRARRTAGLRCAVLLSAVPIPGSRGTARSPARLAVSVPLRAPRRSALRRRRLSSRHRALHLHALTEHVVVSVLKHLLRGIIPLKRDEPESSALMVVRVAHHQHLFSEGKNRQSIAQSSPARELFPHCLRIRPHAIAKTLAPPHRVVDRAPRSPLASRTSITGPNCEKKFLTTPASVRVVVSSVPARSITASNRASRIVPTRAIDRSRDRSRVASRPSSSRARASRAIASHLHRRFDRVHRRRSWSPRWRRPRRSRPCRARVCGRARARASRESSVRRVATRRWDRRRAR